MPSSTPAYLDKVALLLLRGYGDVDVEFLHQFPHVSALLTDDVLVEVKRHRYLPCDWHQLLNRFNNTHR